MIFGRKYIFEGRTTRIRRLMLNALFALLILIVFYATFLFYIPLVARSEKMRMNEGLYQKAPDFIIVFTGDKGRIAQALKLQQQWPEAKLFISGVYGTNSLQTLAESQNLSSSLPSESSVVDIDYDSQNTFENVVHSIQYLKENSQESHNNTIIVSSDYHIYRIRKIVETLNDPPIGKFYYEGLKSNWTEEGQIYKLLKESIKCIRTAFILIGQSNEEIIREYQN